MADSVSKTRGFAGRGTLRLRASTLLIAFSLACSSLVLLVPATSAVHADGLFELDGNAANTGAVPPGDWNSLGSPVASIFIAEPSSTDTSYFSGGGSKDVNDLSSWDGDGAGAPDKNEITNAYAAMYLGGDGERRVYFGLDRFDTSGDANIGFWFFKNQVSVGAAGAFTPIHAVGDILVLSDFTKGGVVSTVQVYKWVGGSSPLLLITNVTTAASCATAPSTDSACATVNTGSTPSPWFYDPKGGGSADADFPTSAFFEGGINMGDLIPDTVCLRSFIAESRTSQSLSAVLKDYAMGSFDTCKARVTVDPEHAENPTHTNHVLTILVEKNDGTGWTAAADTLVDALISSGPGEFVSSSRCTTNSTGRCTVTITSDDAGTSVVRVYANVTIGGSTIAVTNNGAGGSSGTVDKDWFVALSATTVITQVHGSAITLGGSVTDVATVTDDDAGPVTAGNVSFFLCSDGDVPCDWPNGTQVGGEEPLNASGQAESDPVTPLAAGDYCFRANYTGADILVDVFLPSSENNPETECFTVDPAATTTTTTPTSTSFILGSAVADQVHVQGLGGDFPTPTGNVSFYLCGEGDVPCGTGSGTLVSNETLDGNGNATSDFVTPLAAGDYCWRAAYWGDANYSASSDNSTNECFEVEPAGSTTLTAPENATLVLGGTNRDGASVSAVGQGLPAPTGNVTFSWCPDGLFPCSAGNGTLIGIVPIDGNGDAVSGSVTPLATGTFCFRGEYAGDANYEPSVDDGVGECFTVTVAPSQTSTTPGAASMVLGGTVNDAAHVDGLGGDFPDPTGTVSFYWCAAGVEPCASGGTLINTVGLDANGNASSADVMPLAAGRYCFRGVYSGDANYANSTDNDTGECFTVTRAPTELVTAPEYESIQLGESNRDVGQVLGLDAPFPAPTGTVTFLFCADGAFPCEAGAIVGAPALNGTGGAVSDAATPLATGEYCFGGAYAGDANYQPSVDNSSGECFTVTPADSNTTTLPRNETIILGTSNADIVHVDGLGGDFPTPTGNVTFYLCGEGDVPCTTGGTLLDNATLDVEGNATSAAVTPTATGTYCFRGEYAGDANYGPSSDASESECFTVTPADSTTTTIPSDDPIVLGESNTDTVHVDGLGGNFPVPTGNVSFYLCAGPAPCTTGGDFVGNEALNATGDAMSNPVTPTAAGTYCFRGDYAGDANYGPSSDASESECFDVTPADSNTTTLPRNETTVLGGSNADTVHVDGLGGDFPTPTGNVTFYVCDEGEVPCTTGGTFIGNATLDEDGNATSAAVTPHATGRYCFRAEYEGDANYNPSADNSTNECFTVTPADSDTITVPSDAQIVLGDTTADTAHVEGLGGDFPTPTGTIEFYLCPEGIKPCDLANGTLVSAETLDAGGNATSDEVTPLATGEYCLRAAYGGDANYAGSSENAATECFEVLPAGSTTTTGVTDPTITLGGTTTDAVHVEGLGAPFPGATGNVTFFLCAVGFLACPAGGSLVSNGTLNGTGDAESDPVTPTTAGSYCFRAEYEGDANYNESIDDGTDECFDVDRAPSTTTTSPSDDEIVLGESTNDTVHVAGLGGSFPTPTGNVSFTLCGEGIDPCGWGGQFIGNATLDQDGNATGPNVTPQGTGRYCFRGEYEGDANYNASADNSTNECFTVTPAGTDTITVPSDAEIFLGDTTTDTAHVQGLGAPFPTPSGTITFYVCPESIKPCDAANGTFVSSGTLDGSGNATSDAVTPLTTGEYCFRAVYGGDPNYSDSSENATTECFDVLPADSTTTTGVTDPTITLGGNTTDTVHVEGLGAPFPGATGNVTFFLCAVGFLTCPAGGDLVSEGTLNSTGDAESDPVTPTTAGSYCFRAEYEGDANYNESIDDGAGECFDVDRAPSTTTTAPSDDEIVLGESTNDTAHVDGLGGNFPGPTGNVSFTLCAESIEPCGTGGQFIGNASLDADGNATSADVTPLATGRYCFRGEYGGDANYNASADNSTNECFDVTPAPSTTTTAAENATIVLGATNRDAAHVAGLGGDFPGPTGNVTFYLCAEGDEPCDTGGTVIGNVSLNGNGDAISPSVMPLATGRYCFRAAYGGDGNYAGSVDDGVGECFNVTAAPSDATTTPSRASIVLGEPNNDTVHVTGLGSPFPTPTGNVTFYLCAESVDPCANGGGEVSNATLDPFGNATSADVTTLTTGRFCFRAVYWGDGNYSGSADTTSLECFDVTAAASTTTTAPSSATIALGESTNDTAHVEGLGSPFPTPTGNVSFYLCAPGIEPCGAGGQFLGNVSLDSAGNATSADVVPLTAGRYCFRGEYEGDANYNASADNSTNECFDVTRANSATVTTPTKSSINVGRNNTDTAVVAGLGGAFPDPTGNVTFYLCGPNVTACDEGSGTRIGTVPLVDGSATSGNVTPDAEGTWCFRAEYEGDANYQPSADGSVTECFRVVVPVTRTQGFWSTHFDIASETWLSITAADRQFCSPVKKAMGDGSGDVAEMEGGFWASLSHKTVGGKRTAVEQARMQLTQQLLAAMLNHEAFGTDDEGLIADGLGAYCDPNATVAMILANATALDEFNNSGDEFAFPSGFDQGDTDSKAARQAANKAFWNVVP